MLGSYLPVFRLLSTCVQVEAYRGLAWTGSDSYRPVPTSGQVLTDLSIPDSDRPVPNSGQVLTLPGSDRPVSRVFPTSGLRF